MGLYINSNFRKRRVGEIFQGCVEVLSGAVASSNAISWEAGVSCGYCKAFHFHILKKSRQIAASVA